MGQVESLLQMKKDPKMLEAAREEQEAEQEEREAQLRESLEVCLPECTSPHDQRAEQQFDRLLSLISSLKRRTASSDFDQGYVVHCCGFYSC